MNECHFLGNLVRDPELKTTPGGKTVMKLTLAVNRRYKRGDNLEKETAFLNCEIWDTGAEVLAKYAKKGTPIIVHCSVKQDTWKTPEGENRSALVFRINKFDFVPGNRRDDDHVQDTDANQPEAEPTSASKSTGKGRQKAKSKSDEGEEEVPF
jgi:single-strand DNA-binding protein